MYVLLVIEQIAPSRNRGHPLTRRGLPLISAAIDISEEPRTYPRYRPLTGWIRVAWGCLVIGEFLFLTTCPPTRCDPDVTVRRIALILRPVLDRLLGDPSHCRWSFQRLPDVRVGTSVRLSFHAATPVLDALEAQSEQALDELGWQTSTDRELFRADVPADRVGMVFSTLSSELALALLVESALPAAAKRAFAVTHLLRLVTLVPEADRATFLFTCWRDSSARMSRAQRVVIAREADRWDSCPVREDVEFAWDHGRTGQWQRYLDAIGELAADARAAELPLNYLLFDHARLTHNRVGISPDNEGFAAWLLRSALVNGDITRRELATV